MKTSLIKHTTSLDVTYFIHLLTFNDDLCRTSSSDVVRWFRVSVVSWVETDVTGDVIDVTCGDISSRCSITCIQYTCISCSSSDPDIRHDMRSCLRLRSFVATSIGWTTYRDVGKSHFSRLTSNAYRTSIDRTNIYSSSWTFVWLPMKCSSAFAKYMIFWPRNVTLNFDLSAA